MTEQKDEGLEIVERLEDVPPFAHEDDEAHYWATHALGDAILDQMGPVEDGFLPSPRPRTTPVPIRFNEDVIQRAKALAARRHIGYQTLLKEFVTERLYEEEKRAGLR